MNLSSERLTRQHAIEYKVQHIERRIARAQFASNRISWVRVLVFVGGLLGALGIGTLDAFAGWCTFLIAALVFVIVVLYHQRVEHWIETFTIWRSVRVDQLARLTLTWNDLPNPAPVVLRVNHSLARDLDLTGARSLHHLLDTTLSRQGSQLLADWLTEPEPVLEQIHTRQKIVRELVPLTRFRDRFRLTFRMVMKEKLEGEKLLHWLTVEFPSRQLKWALPFAVLFIAVNLTLLGLNLWGGQPAYWMLSLLLYVVFYISNQPALSSALDAMVRLDAELDRFGGALIYLERFAYAGSENLAGLCAPFHHAPNRPSAYMRKIKLVTAAIGLRSNPLLGIILNLVFPWDFFFAWLTDYYRRQVLDLFPTWVQTCYTLDALIALANFASLNPEYTFPEITRKVKPILQAADLGHPLIPFHQSVRNSFTLHGLGELAIITGSNMAGKSTFLKTVGTNLCLAYAGAPVNAVSFQCVPFRIQTCIRISDSIVDGFSYFYAEVKCLKRLLDELKSQHPLPVLYLIDEIFRGTNNRERLLGSRAYVRALLGANGSGLLATHDLELAGLADHSTQAHNYHFEDQVLEGKLIFDYTLRPGPSSTTNALKIMEMEGLPIDGNGSPCGTSEHMESS